MKRSNHYHWIEFVGPAEEAELASWRLFEAGVPALEELEGKPGEAHFKVSHIDEELIDHLSALLPEWRQSRGRAPNQDWDAWWKEQQHPIEVTPRLRILPPWVQATPLPGVLDLTIEAKMAFGTGHHETTRLAALLMERHLSAAPAKGRAPRLLDIGTGTGILAMYAHHLGADPIGTEIDPVTVECLAENWKNNGLGEARAILGPLTALRKEMPFEAIICNMIRTEVWPLREEIIERLAPEGLFVISGQLATEKELVLQWFAEASLELIGEATESEWWAAAALYRP